MAEDKTTNEDLNTAQGEDTVEKGKEQPKATRKRRSPAREVKVTGLVNTMYLGAGDVVHVTATDQLQELADRGFVKIEKVDNE